MGIPDLDIHEHLAPVHGLPQLWMRLPPVDAASATRLPQGQGRLHRPLRQLAPACSGTPKADQDQRRRVLQELPRRRPLTFSTIVCSQRRVTVQGS